ncbi:MAG TPA: hybrid sensor histidine kinase/response regulator, partial [Microcoleaceae bacterium UBA10368]|nr:hybrid sensor histidine kinase/response regulator [Microcoleaceae cyanobacterium UBA10368]
MPLTNPSLKNFLEPVPLVPHTAKLAALRSIFRSCNCDRVAVVNEQLQPLGLVYLRSLMPLADRSREWEQRLSEITPATLAPLSSVSADQSVSEFWQYLQTGEINTKTANPQKNKILLPDSTSLGPAGSIEGPLALTNSDGQFLGLLDSLSLLKFVAVNTSSIVRERATDYSLT